MIEVVAGILSDAAGRVLLAQRPPRGPHAGLWEFPGGKLEHGESPAAALRRELREELGIEVEPGERLWRVTWRYPHLTIALDAIAVRAFSGEPCGTEGQAVVWVAPDELHRWPMPAADVPIASALRLARQYAITSDPGDDAAHLLADARARLAAGSRLLQIRAKQLDVVALDTVLVALRDAAMSAGARVLVNGAAGLALAAAHPWIGVHLTGADLARAVARPLPRPRQVAASCHDAQAIERAVALDCDFIVLGPVLPTASHPGATLLGWPVFAALSATCPLPVFALGGISPHDLAIARDHGAFGVAGIRAFGRTPIP